MIVIDQDRKFAKKLNDRAYIFHSSTGTCDIEIDGYPVAEYATRVDADIELERLFEAITLGKSAYWMRKNENER